MRACGSGQYAHVRQKNNAVALPYCRANSANARGFGRLQALARARYRLLGSDKPSTATASNLGAM